MGPSAYYLRNTFNPKLLRATVHAVNRKLKNMAKDLTWDVLAFRGNSGAGVCYALAYKYGWNICCMRKPAEKSHGQMVEASIHFDSYLIVDDFMSSGSTVRGMIEDMHDEVKRARCVGVLLYSQAAPRRIVPLDSERVVAYGMGRSSK